MGTLKKQPWKNKLMVACGKASQNCQVVAEATSYSSCKHVLEWKSSDSGWVGKVGLGE